MKISEHINLLHMAEKLVGHRDYTIKSYSSNVEKWLRWSSNNKCVLSTESIKNYLYEISLKNKNSTVNLAIDAIKFHVCNVIKSPEIVSTIKHLKTDKPLPRIHSKEECFDIIDSMKNVKHRLLLMLSYVCGLRVGEAVSLRVSQVNIDRMQLRINSEAKGGKHRILPLDKSQVDLFVQYCKNYGELEYIFSGQNGGHISKRTAEKIYSSACMKSGVVPTGFHTLRHSFATHLIEMGYDIHLVRKLMGHKSIRTTEIYLHLSNKYMSEIKNPMSDYKKESHTVELCEVKFG